MRREDGDSLRVAWDQHHARQWRAVLAWAGNPEVASDAVAEAYAQAARRAELIDDVGAWTWRASFRIAAGMLADRRLTVPSGGARSPELAAPATLPDEVLAFTTALAALTDLDRQIVVLCLVGGWSAKEVGQMVGSSPGAVRVRLHRARAKVLRWMEVSDD